MSLSGHAYPADLARYVLDHATAGAFRCEPDTLVEVLTIAYHASLLREEERPLSFRLLVAPSTESPLPDGLSGGHHWLRLDPPRVLDAQEIRRLAPAAKMQRAMIGVFGDAPSSVQIWGLVQTGPGWLHAIQGGRERVAAIPDALIVAVTGPGRLLVSVGGVTVARLSAGTLSGRSADVFESRWLREVCGENRRDVMAEHERVRAGASLAAQGLLRGIDQQLVRRIIANVRLAHHGGTVVILPLDEAERVGAAAKPIALKYRFADEEPQRRYRSLQLRLLGTLDALDEGLGRAPSWETYVASTHPEVVAIDQALLELAHTIAGLAAVDGAVVLNKRFEILGFGGEIVGDLPDVHSVRRALDPEGDAVEDEATDRVGTRHRSLYRLCAAIPNAVGIVVSQDGGVRLVANKDGAVTCWDNLGTGPMEL